MYSGLFELPWWGYVVYTLVVTHITIAAVTIYLHRHSAHRALDLHPVVSHFFRLWLWMTTGMDTKAWTAIHRKHHARCETEEDPHSPQILGINTLLFQGADLYKRAAKDQDILEKFGHGTPDDWLERNVYHPHSVWGIALMMIINFALFGFLGIVIWVVQMAWIPIFAAGVINGIGHYVGYRSYDAEDASRNISPWGILIGGEELHNNHHAYPTSARLSSKWYEFDIGWLYIRTLETIGLAEVHRVAPQVKLAAAKADCDAATLQAVITHRYDVLTQYARTLKGTCVDELHKLRARAVRVDGSLLRRSLSSETPSLQDAEKADLKQALEHSKVLTTIHHMRDELTALWQRSTATTDQLVVQLNDWCKRAEASGISALEKFSKRLRSYI
ncbi:MAG: DesA family fatty acid desaturase [Burkholderiales bacterium]